MFPHISLDFDCVEKPSFSNDSFDDDLIDLKVQRFSTFDYESLFSRAPQRLKNVLKDAQKNDRLSVQKINLQNLGFQKKITAVNFCSNCILNSKKCMCQNHKQSDVEIDCQINQNEQNQFVLCFTMLFQIGINKDSPELLYKIYLQLVELNKNSVYYNRMTFKILTLKQQKINNFINNNQYIFLLCKQVENYQQLLYYLGSDLRTRMNIIKFFCKNQRKQMFNTIVNKLVDIISVRKLIQQQFYHDLIYQKVRKQKKNQYQQLFAKLLLLRVKKVEKSSQLFIWQYNFENSVCYIPGIAQQIIYKIIQIYPSSEQIIQQVNQKERKAQRYFHQQVQKQQSKLPSDVIDMNKLLAKAVLSIIAQKLQFSLNIKSCLIQRKYQNKLLNIFYWMSVQFKENIKFIPKDQNNLDLNLIALLLLIKQLSDNVESKEKLLTNLFQYKSTVQNNQQKFFQLANVFIHVINIIFRADICYIIEKKKLQKRLKQNKLTSAQENEQLRNWFKTFLYIKKQIKKEQILKLKKQGVLNFEGAGSLLNQLCGYTEFICIFEYKSSKIFKNQINGFPLISTNQKYQSLYKNKVCYNQQLQFKKGGLTQNLLDLLLSCKSFIPIFQEQWKKTKENNQYLNSNEKIGYLYLLVLVLYDKLTKGSNQFIKNKIQQLLKDESSINEYSNKEEEIYLIKKLLGLIKQQKKQSIKQQQNIVSSNLDSQIKKTRIAQKFQRTKRQSIQEVKQHIKEQYNNQNYDGTCVVCHQGQKSEDFLVYLSIINKNYTISSSVYGKNNLSNIFISSCFHTIHLNCYSKQNKHLGFKLTCPVCQKIKKDQRDRNCVIGTLNNIGDKNFNDLWQNAIIVSMANDNQIYDVQSNFILLFKHLVDSKGLNSLLSLSRYQQNKKKWQENDNYFLVLMEAIYQHFNQKQKETYIKEINTFIQQIESCTRFQCKIVQLVFAIALKSFLTGDDDHETILKLLLEVRATIKEEEFIIVEEHLCGLFHEKDLVKIPQPTAEQLQKQKVSLSFNIKQLPQTAQECQNLFKDKNCELCEKQKGSQICLTCSQIIGENCQTQHNKKTHVSLNIFFNLKSYKIHRMRLFTQSFNYVYYNEFKVAYKSQYNPQVDQPKDFILDQNILKDLINYFVRDK